MAVETASGVGGLGPSGALGFDPDTGHWSDLQHNAETDARSTEEYSGWVPAGSDRTNGAHYSADHSAAERAYAAKPAIDP